MACYNDRMKPCPDCNQPIQDYSPRCRSCTLRRRWRENREKLAAENRYRDGPKPYHDREWLRSRYEDQRMTMREIAEETGTGFANIARWLRIHNIPTRKTNDYHKAHMAPGPSNPNWKGGPKPCPICGGRKANPRSRTCKKCSSYKGPKNPNWIGIADITTLLRTWCTAEWRPKVFERDNYTCQECGSKEGGTLNAHHIKPLGRIVRAERKAWTLPLETPDQRYAFYEHLIQVPAITSIENGITLCVACHHSKHARTDPRNRTERHKLTPQERIEIRQLLDTEEYRVNELAIRFKVSEATIRRIP
jgi:5-methylcytosine-specific restriction endonuclease McrA